MNYHQLMYWHMATVLAAFVLGTAQMLMPKGTPLHRSCGRGYMVLMMATALVALCMPAHIGPALWGHFGWIHLLCLLTLWAVPRAWLAARRGNIGEHRRTMVILYCAALLAAGAFTLLPGRYLNQVLFG